MVGDDPPYSVSTNTPVSPRTMQKNEIFSSFLGIEAFVANSNSFIIESLCFVVAQHDLKATNSQNFLCYSYANS